MGKGKGSKGVFNFKPQGNKKSGKPKGIAESIFLPTSKKQTSRKVHDSKNKQSHGQGKKF
jgi:hypothetical protein